MAAKKINEEILGYAEFGAYMHRDNGGKARIAAYTSVNKPLSVEAHNETTKIASKRYKIIEEERAELNGNTFYSKDIWNEQEGSSGTPASRSSHNDVPTNTGNGTTPNADGLTPLQVLKNFVDNIAADVRQHTWLLVAIGCIAAAALVLAIAK